MQYSTTVEIKCDKYLLWNVNMNLLFDTQFTVCATYFLSLLLIPASLQCMRMMSSFS